MYQVYTPIKALLIVIFSAILINCSSSDKKGIYEDVAVEKPLVVPPGIVMPRQNSALTVPEIAPQTTTYKIYSQTQLDGSGEVLKVRTTGIRLVHDGAIRWLEIDAKPKEIWTKAIKFFELTGFNILRKQPKIGLIETDWLENKSSTTTNWFSGFLNNLSFMDKYRVRLERNNANTRTLMFITHQGLKSKEIDVGDDDEVQDTETIWVMRDSNLDLEAEMLQRFLVYLGNDESVISKVFADSKPQKRTTLLESNGKDGKASLLVVKEIFSRTWRRTGLAIDRLGFAVEDRNRSAGIYYIKVSKKFIESETKDDGFFSKLFSEDILDITQFIISLDDKNQETHIRVLTRQGDENKSPLQKRILEKLDKLLK